MRKTLLRVALVLAALAIPIMVPRQVTQGPEIHRGLGGCEAEVYAAK